jgi:hypothetical protein
MDLKSLGRRDIFGILLPGTIPVIIGTYAIYAALASLQSSIGDIFKQEFLVTALMFVSAYLVGSLLRLFAADSVDEKSGKHLLQAWWKESKGCISKGYESEFKEKMVELLKGNNVPEIPAYFDDWLWLSDKFPYIAWHNRFWRSQGFQEILDFFQQNHKNRMWPQSNASPKSFFNYCKLAIIDGGGALAEEVNTAEGITRFFAGTFTGLRLSIWLLLGSVSVQILLMVGLAFAQKAGSSVILGLDWKTQSIYLVLSLVLVFALLWMCRRIIEQFRTIRQKEAETVFHAFYLYVTQPYKQFEEKKRAA